jgi:hypothetical protein
MCHLPSFDDYYLRSTFRTSISNLLNALSVYSSCFIPALLLYYSPAKHYSGQRVENISLFRIGRFETKSSHTYNLSCYKRAKKIYYFGTWRLPLMVIVSHIKQLHRLTPLNYNVYVRKLSSRIRRYISTCN